MAINKKYCFIYKTTNLITGKPYVGLHTTNNLNDRYIGSGHEFKKILKEFGRKNFEFEILEFCLPCKKHLAYRERFFVKKFNSQKPNGYNLTSGGEGLNDYEFTEEHKEKLRIATLLNDNIHKEVECPWCLDNPDCDLEGRKQKERSLETREKLSILKKQYHISNPNRFEVYEKIRQSNIGRKDSLETRNKKSKARKGEKNPMYGKTHSEEVCETIRQKRIKNGDIYKTEDFRLKQSIANSLGKNSMAVPIINLETGEEYSCMKEAYLDSNFEKSIQTFRRYINSGKINYIYKN